MGDIIERVLETIVTCAVLGFIVFYVEITWTDVWQIALTIVGIVIALPILGWLMQISQKSEADEHAEMQAHADAAGDEYTRVMRQSMADIFKPEGNDK